MSYPKFGEPKEDPWWISGKPIRMWEVRDPILYLISGPYAEPPGPEEQEMIDDPHRSPDR